MGATLTDVPAGMTHDLEDLFSGKPVLTIGRSRKGDIILGGGKDGERVGSNSAHDPLMTVSRTHAEIFVLHNGAYVLRHNPSAKNPTEIYSRRDGSVIRLPRDSGENTCQAILSTGDKIRFGGYSPVVFEQTP